MAKLTELKSEAVFRRQKRKRTLIRGLRGESAAAMIGEIEPGCEIFGFTKGQFSCIDVFLHCLEYTGPADVFIATWSAAAGDIGAAHKFLESGKIRSLRFLIDLSFKSRKPEFLDEMVYLFGEDAIRVTVTHAKYAVITNESWNLVVRTSMNLNYNPRFENFEISDDKAFADFQLQIVDEIWSNQEAGKGLRERPQATMDRFNQQWSLFGDDLRDMRELL